MSANIRVFCETTNFLGAFFTRIITRDFFEHELNELNEYFFCTPNYLYILTHTDRTDFVRGGALTGFEHEIF